VQLAADLASRLKGARRVVVFTGAGVSAESGIPTFRDPQTGLWRDFDAQALATPEAFERDPALVWGWYEWRRSMVRASEPNAAHRAIAALQGRVAQLTLITQNVDDLHERAGNAQVLHLHGRLGSPYCSACGCEYTPPPPRLRRPGSPQPAPLADAASTESTAKAAGDGGRLQPPRCGRCGGRVRPGVVWFGETLPMPAWQQALDASRACDAFLCVGTSSIVEPAAGLTRVAIAAGSTTVQVNIDHTVLDDLVTLNLRGPAASVLPELVAAVWPDA
jgi:NAD-dependent deacetylase